MTLSQNENEILPTFTGVPFSSLSGRDAQSSFS